MKLQGPYYIKSVFEACLLTLREGSELTAHWHLLLLLLTPSQSTSWDECRQGRKEHELQCTQQCYEVVVEDIVVLELELLLTFSENAWDGCRVRRRECTVWRSASVVLSHNYLVFLAVLIHQVSSLERVLYNSLKVHIICPTWEGIWAPKYFQKMQIDV